MYPDNDWLGHDALRCRVLINKLRGNKLLGNESSFTIAFIRGWHPFLSISSSNFAKLKSVAISKTLLSLTVSVSGKVKPITVPSSCNLFLI